MKTILTKTNLENVQAFVRNFAPAALAMEAAHKLPALAVLAQAALETGWGAHILKVQYNGVLTDSKNIFNIKAGQSWTGKKGVRNVWEIVDGKKVWVDSWFRMYDSYEASFDDYATYIIHNPRYTKALLNVDDAERYIEEIHAAGYATDPEYADKIKTIMKKYFVEVDNG